MSLKEYRKKRHFAKTPEPLPAVAKRSGWSFVVQKHAASHLHYDFRLELDGVLKSWAVPKGPSLDPQQRRLAMHVEDHPVKYGDFEGIIPEGEYGGGTVMLWDRGVWEPVGDARAGYRSGRLKFRLRGEKLSGGWMLVLSSSRSPDRKGNEWFLIKERDEAARSLDQFSITESRAESVASGRSLEEIAADKDQVWRSNRAAKGSKRKPVKSPRRAKPLKLSELGRLTGAKKATTPRKVEVQLATLVTEAPEGDQWLHEIKLDGYRMICRVEGGKARFISRNQQDWTAELPLLAAVAGQLPVREAILDGEVVAMKPDGTTDFQTLQNAFSVGDQQHVVYFAFDLLFVNGYDVRKVGLSERKKLLEKIVAAGTQRSIRLSEHVAGNGKQFFREAGRLGLEGIISKLADRPYVAGRSLDWQKVKVQQNAEFVIGGYTDPGVRGGFGSLLLGYYDKQGNLIYSGKVGTGFSDAMLRDLRERMDALLQDASPFKNLRGKTGVARDAHWIQPKLVGQIAFSNWTRGGHLRHPSFLGLREDKPAQMVHKESPVSKAAARVNKPKASAKLRRTKAAPAAADLKLTNPQRILYPGADITKVDLAQFYLDIAPWIMPHVANRPLALVRCPEGEGTECFFQKHPGVGTPDTFRQIPIRETNKTRNYLLIDDVQDLVAIAQIGALEIHVWGSQADKIEMPDRMIFDLDPDQDLDWPIVVDSAHQIRQLLEAGGLVSFVKTTGGKGLHIVVPLLRRHDWDEVKGFSKAVAEKIEELDPQHFVSNMSKVKRRGKIFVDYLRNGRGATAIAAYSTRAKPGAPVSVPLAWKELTPAIRSNDFTVQNLRERLRSLKTDPWEELPKIKQSLTATVRRKLGLAQ
ncbi:MAG TPA: DNA ligase D [Methylomirabilota bacterium]|nr:DNA ligase D [Methylomirabilota bacterium]